MPTPVPIHPYAVILEGSTFISSLYILSVFPLVNSNVCIWMCICMYVFLFFLFFTQKAVS